MPMSDRDYYEILGSRSRRHARRHQEGLSGLAQKYHPDVNPGDKTAETKFKEVQQAYDILRPEKRALYDRRAGRVRGNGRRRTAQPRPGVGIAIRPARCETIDLSDLFGSFGDPMHGDQTGGPSIFEDIIGRVRGSRAGKTATDATAQEANLTIPFLTAVRGGETTIEIQRADGKPGNIGRPDSSRSGHRGQAAIERQGRPVPEGNAGGRSDHHRPRRVRTLISSARSGNLQVEVPISVSEAILGAKIDVPRLNGMRSLPIPAGSSSGQKLRLKGQGVPASGGKPEGDLFVVLKVIVPKTIDDASRKLIEEFAEQNPAKPSSRTVVTFQRGIKKS